MKYWVMVFPSSRDTNHVLNEHKNFQQYRPYAMPSELMPCYSYLASLVNQNAIPVELSCEWAHLALIVSLKSMKILTNMAHMKSYPS